jgi:hypothetical protein
VNKEVLEMSAFEAANEQVEIDFGIAEARGELLTVLQSYSDQTVSRVTGVLQAPQRDIMRTIKRRIPHERARQKIRLTLHSGYVDAALQVRRGHEEAAVHLENRIAEAQQLFKFSMWEIEFEHKKKLLGNWD